MEEIKNIGLIYFSGTGGTKRIAGAFEKELRDRGITVFKKNLGASHEEKKEAADVHEIRGMDLNILIYPVYAMDAPRPVYDWISNSSGDEAGRNIAVLSVSGGGEMWPNKGCRNECCKALKNRGFQVIYDRMMVMPANVLIEYSDHLIMHLLNAIPKKVSQIVDELLEGKVRCTKFRKGPVLRWVSRSEMQNSGKFAKGFEITESCTSCGWCVRNCPTQNIGIPEPTAKPEFSDRCIVCTRCIYGCPVNAIKTKGSLSLKHGFNLDAVEKRMQGIEPEPVEKCCKGLIYKGVKDYLMDKY